MVYISQLCTDVILEEQSDENESQLSDHGLEHAEEIRAKKKKEREERNKNTDVYDPDDEPDFIWPFFTGERMSQISHDRFPWVRAVEISS
jgi:hypothetical protein